MSAADNLAIVELMKVICNESYVNNTEHMMVIHSDENFSKNVMNYEL